MEYYQNKLEAIKLIDGVVARKKDFSIELFIFEMQKQYVLSPKKIRERIMQHVLQVGDCEYDPASDWIIFPEQKEPKSKEGK